MTGEERGSVTVEFLAGAVMMILVTVALVQVGLYVYVRAVAIEAARTGARLGLVAGAGAADAAAAAGVELRRVPALTGGVDVSARDEGAEVVVSASGTVYGIGIVPDLPLHIEVRARDEDIWSGDRAA